MARIQQGRYALSQLTVMYIFEKAPLTERRANSITNTHAATKVSAAAAKQQHQYNDNQDQLHGKSPLTVPGLFTADRILQSTNRVLNFAGSLVGLAFRFKLLIA
jgi:hypothetical protein